MASTAAASVKRWAREYETIYILRPNVDNDTAEKIVERVKDVISRLDGTLTKLDNWGKRKLAYPIQKNNRGIFVYLKYVGFSDLVPELERNLRLLDEVVRFQTVLLEEDIDPASVAVDPDELQYLHVEEEEETEDAELARARSLGMAPRAPREAPTVEAAPPAVEAASPAAEGDSSDAKGDSPTAEGDSSDAKAESVETAADDDAAPAKAAVEAPEAEPAAEESDEAESADTKSEEG